MLLDAEVEYLSAGGNRHPSAADIHVKSGTLCYGSDRNLIVWPRSCSSLRGYSRITQIVNAHQDSVTAVRFVQRPSTSFPILLSASADRKISLWQSGSEDVITLRFVKEFDKHKGSVNCLAVSNDCPFIASGATDGNIIIWQLVDEESGPNLLVLQTIELKSKYFPLAIALHPLHGYTSFLLAVGGTRKTIDVYTSQEVSRQHEFTWQGELSGHDGWVRSLDCVSIKSSTSHDIYLASASQDKYIRLWRIREGDDISQASLSLDGNSLQTLSNKTQCLMSGTRIFQINFEALLLGHEDWIFTARWDQDSESLRLLSGSADNSVVIWEPETSSGIWICKDRLGEVSISKGATTATGSTGGFWITLWADCGRSIVGLGRTGGWRCWSQNIQNKDWISAEAVTGHTKDVRDVSWSESGNFMLSASADQSTRVHAMQDEGAGTRWFELARPQIHGYDLNCIEAIGDWQFVSGADEKLLRVFNAPAPFATSLQAMSQAQVSADHDMPKAAAVPVLGLSNKEAETGPQIGADNSRSLLKQNTESVGYSLNGIRKIAPSEDYLSRHTLWPEHEKLYGHGFEVSALAVSHDKSMIATACKASSSEHAVIRIYDTKTWLAAKQVLVAHSLTVTCLAFSEDDSYLISGGRDRQWSLFERSGPHTIDFILKTSNPKGHSRMILGISWIQSRPQLSFGTAGRDRCIKIWTEEHGEFTCGTTIHTDAPVTCIHFCTQNGGRVVLGACGLDTGRVLIHALDPKSLEVITSLALAESITPSLSVNRVKWQPIRSVERSKATLTSNRLAIGSQDSSVRIVRVLST